MNPFDFVNSINYNKTDLFENNLITENQYARYLINRAESYFPDTVLIANQANLSLTQVPIRTHFEFYRQLVPVKKRFSKWTKYTPDKDLIMIQKYCNLDVEEAKLVLYLMNEDQLNRLRKEYSRIKENNS